MIVNPCAKWKCLGFDQDIVVIDIETTGLDPNMMLSEIGAVKIKNRKVVTPFKPLLTLKFPYLKKSPN